MLKDHGISISKNDEGCYDTVIREGGAEHWVEVTLGTGNRIEDCYCDKCKSLLCVHTVAVLQIISENTKINADENSNSNKLSPN